MSSRRPTYVCAACGAAQRQMGRALRGLRRLEHHRRGRRRSRPGRGRTLGPARGRRMAIEDLGGARAAAAAARQRHRRARPGARRRAGAGERGAGRRRPRHRQVDAAPAGGGGLRRAAARRRSTSRARRRRRRSGCARRGSGSRDAPLGLAAETNLRDILTTLEAERPDLAVIDSIQTMWADHVESAPGSVAQVRAAAHELVGFAKRRGAAVVLVGPRHQGRADRRPAGGRAHGRHRALLRGRARPPVPHPARGQEPLRPGGRDRGLRDDRRRARRGGEPLGAVPLRARQPGLRLGGLRRRRGHAAAARRGAGAGGADARSAPPGARCSAGTRAGSPWCWRCSRRAAASASPASTSISTSPAACAITEPAADLAVAAALLSARAGHGPAGATRCSSARSASRARCAPIAQAEARLREAAKLGFAAAFAPARLPAPEGAGLAIHPVADLPAFIEKCFGRIDR